LPRHGQDQESISMKKVFIIAEVGVNHNGSLKIAKKMIDIAKKFGCNAIKFQSFIAESVISKFAPKAEYQMKGTNRKESQLEMVRDLQLDMEQHKQLINYCIKQKIVFISSPFDLESIDMLNKLELKIFKIPSGEITNLPYLKKIGKLKKSLILSTGMSDLKEVRTAIDILRRAGTSKNKITVLHCNSDYPTSAKDVNLLAMITLKKEFGVDIGYSDHTIGIEIPVAAAALGASVIEKHFTLDRTMTGPDHKASLEPTELKTMVNAVRNIEKALGNGIKKPSFSELKNRKVVRKSIVALRSIVKGEIFTESNITVKRPGNGISPMGWDKVIGRRSRKNFKKDELIKI